MITNETSIAHAERGSEPEPINKPRRTFIGGAVAALLASSQRVKADD
jgi:hypothetical protein